MTCREWHEDRSLAGFVENVCNIGMIYISARSYRHPSKFNGLGKTHKFVDFQHPSKTPQAHSEYIQGTIHPLEAEKKCLRSVHEEVR